VAAQVADVLRPLGTEVSNFSRSGGGGGKGEVSRGACKISQVTTECPQKKVNRKPNGFIGKAVPLTRKIRKAAAWSGIHQK